MHKKVIFILLLFVLLCSHVPGFHTVSVRAAAKPPLARYGRLHVSGRRLVDSHGKTVQLKGVSTHGLSWYPQYVNKKAFQTLRDQWGAEVIRLAMYTAEYNGYCTGTKQNQKELKSLIDKAVRCCDELGLYVIIDWHIVSDSDPHTYQKEAKAFFQSMAKKYAGYKNVIYEICNEPNGGVTWAQICSYARPVIQAIRRQDAKAVIIVGTPTWSQDVDTAAAAPLKGKNLMYAFHYYASTHTDDMRKKLQAALDQGLAVFVTEYGICEASGNGMIKKNEANRWMKLLDQNKISCVAWNLSNKEEASALLKSTCAKTFGWKRSDLSESGKWVYDMMRKK